MTSICVATIVAMICVGCTSETEIIQSPVLKKDSDSTSDVQVVNDEKKSTESIPDDFPSDIHIVGGAKSTDFKKTGSKNNLVLEYHESSNEDLIKSYFAGMSEQGWTQVSSSELPIGTITNFTKESRKCTISIGPPKDKLVMVAVIY